MIISQTDKMIQGILFEFLIETKKHVYLICNQQQLLILHI